MTVEPLIDVELVVVDPRRAAVLARPTGGRYEVPAARLPWESALGMPALRNALLAETGVDAFVLEPVDEAVYVLAPAGDVEPRDGYAWIDTDRVHHPQLRRWLDRPRTGPEWFRPGFLDAALGWIDGALGDLGRVRTGPPQQIQHASMSCVLRVTTNAGAVYFKAVLPSLAVEPSVIGWLAVRAPADVPTVLAHDPDRGWWLAEDFGGERGPDLPPTERNGALALLAGLQQSTVDRTDGLVALGCPRLGPDELAAKVPALMRRADLWAAPGRASAPGVELTAEQRRTWAAFGLRLQDRCADLAELDLPPALVHGDFHAGNVARRESGFLLFDWSFAAVSVPVLDLGAWLHAATEDEARASLRSYLPHWRASVSPATLTAAWSVARPVAALAEVLKFVELADRVGPDYDFQYLPMAYAWVRRLVACLDGPAVQPVGWT